MDSTIPKATQEAKETQDSQDLKAAQTDQTAPANESANGLSEDSKTAQADQTTPRFTEAQATHVISACKPMPLSIREMEAQASIPGDQAERLSVQTRRLLNSVSAQRVQQVLPFTMSLNLEALRYYARHGQLMNQLRFVPMSRELGKGPALYYAQIETESESEWFCQHGTALIMRELDEQMELAEDWLLWKATLGIETLELRYYHPETDRLGVIRLREPYDLHCQVQYAYDEQTPPTRKVYFDVNKDARLGRIVRLLDWQEGLPLASATFYLDTTSIRTEDWTKDSKEMIQRMTLPSAQE